MMNRKYISLDTNILQSRTVGNICLILKEALTKKNYSDLKDASKFIIQKAKVANLKYRTIKPDKAENKTTVDSKVKLIERTDL